jgi:hypothetical protein
MAAGTALALTREGDVGAARYALGAGQGCEISACYRSARRGMLIRSAGKRTQHVSIKRHIGDEHDGCELG